MQIKITNVGYKETFEKYKSHLDKYNAKYFKHCEEWENADDLDDWEFSYYAIIEINSLEELIKLSKDIQEEIIITPLGYQLFANAPLLTIYDSYVE